MKYFAKKIKNSTEKTNDNIETAGTVTERVAGSNKAVRCGKVKDKHPFPCSLRQLAESVELCESR